MIFNRESRSSPMAGDRADPFGECPHCGYDELNCMCDDEDFMDSLDCTHCGGDGLCDDGADPLWSCPPEAHFCHACNGSGKRRDQVIF